VLTPAAVWFYGGYSAALWAMTKVLISSIAALRETSIVFAALIDMCLKKICLWLGYSFLHRCYGHRLYNNININGWYNIEAELDPFYYFQIIKL
jgi:hypothetical protein